MNKKSLFVILPLITLIGGCGSDSPTGGGDTTPPSIGTVMAIDANHVLVTFSESVKKASAEHRENYVILETTPAQTTGALAPGDTTHVASAVLGGDGKTVTVTTQESMQNLPYEMEVSGVEDLSGNKIATGTVANFAGTNITDTTPPQIVQRTPAPGALNVGIGTSVVVQFDEPMNYSSVEGAFMWTWNVGIVSWQMQEEGQNRFVFTPTQPLLNNTLYLVSVQGTAQDVAGNGLAGAPVNWSFTTTATADNTPPTLVSSTPANNLTNVPLTSNISLTFSEPVNQLLEGVMVTPDVGSGVETWSNGGATVTFNPDVDMAANTQYSLTILPGGVFDLAGNGNTTFYQVVWTTGATFHTGQFSGTISGHPGTAAANPAGALVIAADVNPFGVNDNFGIAGSSIVGGGGAYSVMRLPDGWYFPVSAKDTNGDGTIDPDLGDAIGAYGIVWGVDMDPDSIEISGGGSVTGINFALYDPMVISGFVSYSGGNQGSYSFFVGAFDVNGFDPNNLSNPDFGTQGFWPFDPQYGLDEFDSGLAPGTYYVGAFLDVNFNSTFDDGVDPAGFYGGLTPTPIILGPGQDALNINIVMEDTAFLRAARPMSWVRTSTVDPEVREAAAWIRRELAKRK